MNSLRFRLSLILFMCAVTMGLSASAGEQVVLLHGLARSAKSFSKMERALIAEDYSVLNLDYPSRHYPVEELAQLVRKQIVANLSVEQPVHFVTHSMGGILLRYIQQHDPLPNIGRVVMLSPPNQGSEVVDKLGQWKLFQWINGPAGVQLGTCEQGIASQLMAADFELGIITGSRSINWILSLMIPGADDGKVSVESAQLEGMNDFKIVPVSHPFMMKRQSVIREVICFLKKGTFEGIVVQKL